MFSVCSILSLFSASLFLSPSFLYFDHKSFSAGSVLHVFWFDGNSEDHCNANKVKQHLVHVMARRD